MEKEEEEKIGELSLRLAKVIDIHSKACVSSLSAGQSGFIDIINEAYPITNKVEVTRSIRRMMIKDVAKRYLAISLAASIHTFGKHEKEEWKIFFNNLHSDVMECVEELLKAEKKKNDVN